MIIQDFQKPKRNLQLHVKSPDVKKALPILQSEFHDVCLELVQNTVTSTQRSFVQNSKENLWQKKA